MIWYWTTSFQDEELELLQRSLPAECCADQRSFRWESDDRWPLQSVFHPFSWQSWPSCVPGICCHRPGTTSERIGTSLAFWSRGLFENVGTYLSFSIYVRLWLLKGVNYSRGEATAWLQCQECNNEVTGRIDRRMFPRSTQSQLLATLWWQIAFQYWLVGWVPNWKLRQPFDMLLTLLFALPDLWSEVVTYKSSSPISSDVISASDYLHLN